MALARELALQFGVGGLAGAAGGIAIAAALRKLPLSGGLAALFLVAGAIFVFGIVGTAARQRVPRRLHRRRRRRQPQRAGIRAASFGARRRHVAVPDRDVPRARSARDAARARRCAVAGARTRGVPDADRPAARGRDLPRAVPLRQARDRIHRMGGPARCGRHFPRVDPDADAPAAGRADLQRRVHRRACLAARAGMDARSRRARARRRAAASRPRGAARRGRSAGLARARARRLSGRAAGRDPRRRRRCRAGPSSRWSCAAARS